MMDVLTLSGLSKRFGDHVVLQNLDLQVPAHAVFGFIGQNGAGKTTTMKMVLGLLKPDSGSIQVCGNPVRYGETKTNRSIGYLPDVPEFYGYMRPMEYLALCGAITGLSHAQTRRKSEELLSLVGLKDEKKKIGSFSRGMKQRLGIAQALINEPKLLLCDEPTSALDPIGRKDILDILHAIRGKTTVLFSTHILSDVEKICDRIAVLHQGKLALCGTLADIKAKYRHHGFALSFSSVEEATVFAQLKELQRTELILTREENNVTILTSASDSVGHYLLTLLTQHHITPIKFAALEPTLDTLFAEVVQ